LCFWEKDDKFKYEKVIRTELPFLQVRIWSLETSSKWITTDKTHVLHMWALEEEEPISLKRMHYEKVIDLIEVEKLQCMISASLDKQLIVWDFKDFEVRFSIDLKKSYSVHTMKFSNLFDVSLRDLF